VRTILLIFLSVQTGKLITGKKYNLKDGLTAFETLLGWTIIGKLPQKETDTTTIITTMIVQEANLCELWRLDALGITNPVEKIDQKERDKQTREFLLKTARRNPEGRYEINLPWAEDHVLVLSNIDIARNT